MFRNLLYCIVSIAYCHCRGKHLWCVQQKRYIRLSPIAPAEWLDPVCPDYPSPIAIKPDESLYPTPSLFPPLPLTLPLSPVVRMVMKTLGLWRDVDDDPEEEASKEQPADDHLGTAHLTVAEKSKLAAQKARGEIIDGSVGHA